MNYDYFDQDYFLNGVTKGTVYSNYICATRGNSLYYEVAVLIASVFRPSRVLEIGCSTGIIVKHLNDMNIEAHGIDVSEWAIQNREHPNVLCAPVERLPYPDNHFDVVYSVHALEHIPVEHKVAAFSELGRVSGASVHLHMLPIVGLGPYTGESELVRLKKDPTHNLLHDKAWWLEQFSEIGFEDLRLPVFFGNESGRADLGASQLLLANTEVGQTVMERLRAWDTRIFSAKVDAVLAARAGAHFPGKLGAAHTLDLNGPWDDVTFTPEQFIFSDETVCSLVVTIEGNEPINLRLCLISRAREDEGDFWRTFEAGTTIVQIDRSQFHMNRGNLYGKPIEIIYFGGEGSAGVTMRLAVHEASKVCFVS